MDTLVRILNFSGLRYTYNMAEGVVQFNQESTAVVAPPKPEIAIRTMDSDIKAIESGGGDVGSAMRTHTAPLDAQAGVTIDATGYAGPEQALFSGDATVLAHKGGTFWKALALFVLVVVIVAAFAFLGYSLVSRFLFVP